MTFCKIMAKIIGTTQVQFFTRTKLMEITQLLEEMEFKQSGKSLNIWQVYTFLHNNTLSKTYGSQSMTFVDSVIFLISFITVVFIIKCLPLDSTLSSTCSVNTSKKKASKKVHKYILCAYPISLIDFALSRQFLSSIGYPLTHWPLRGRVDGFYSV